ncbi:hypothetical protein BHM03_00030832 [Ensete ventricosum]|nr:hypothetical protein BHM03_00030832 [Ensete ventricosum]
MPAQGRYAYRRPPLRVGATLQVAAPTGVTLQAVAPTSITDAGGYPCKGPWPQPIAPLQVSRPWPATLFP